MTKIFKKRAGFNQRLLLGQKWHMTSAFKKGAGLTLIELIVVIAIIAVLAVMVFVAVRPGERLRATDNSRRWMEVRSIADSIKQYEVDNRGQIPSGIDGTLRMIGTAATNDCNVDCGSTSEVSFQDENDTLNYYSNNYYTVRHWFYKTSFPEFSSMSVSAVLDCDGGCSGTVRVRIGDINSYQDYDLVSASSVRSDGSTSIYTWYANTFPISKSSLSNPFFVQILKYDGSGTIRFLMDESSVSGVDAEYRTIDNGDGTQSGWTNDNGDYFIKVGVPEQTSANCLNLEPSLVDQYFGKIPYDPKEGNEEKTYYAIKRLDEGWIKVISCKADDGEEIQSVR